MFVALVTKPTAIYFQVVVYRKINIFSGLRVILGSILVVFYYINNFVIRQPAKEVLRSKSYKLCAS